MIDPRTATGRYSSRAVLIFIFVSSAMDTFSFTSVAILLLAFKTSTNDGSSNTDPFRATSLDDLFSSPEQRSLLRCWSVSSRDSLLALSTCVCFSSSHELRSLVHVPTPLGEEMSGFIRCRTHGSFVGNDQTEQLIFQSTLSDSEINH